VTSDFLLGPENKDPIASKPQFAAAVWNFRQKYKALVGKATVLSKLQGRAGAGSDI